MEKIKLFFKNLGPNIQGLIKKGTELKQNKPRKYFEIASKVCFGLLLLFGLLLPLFVATNSITTVKVNVFDMPVGWLIFIVFLVLPFEFLVAALREKEALANRLFKVHTILATIIFLFIILSWISVSSDDLIANVAIGFGFIIVFIAFVTMILLTWKPDIILNLIYKVFKVPEVKEVEYVQEPSAE